MESIGKLLVERNTDSYSKIFELKSGDNMIGRPSEQIPSDIEIPGDPLLSRRHFIISVYTDKSGNIRYTVKDNQSTNGTEFKNKNERKKELEQDEVMPIFNETVIKAGDTRFVLSTTYDLDATRVPGTTLSPVKKIDKISVTITEKGRTVYEKITCDDIFHIKASGNYTELYVKSGGDTRKIMESKNLKYFENEFQSDPRFFRIHSSYIVNLEKITSYSKEGKDGSLQLENGTYLPVSRTYKKGFEQVYFSSGKK